MKIWTEYQLHQARISCDCICLREFTPFYLRLFPKMVHRQYKNYVSIVEDGNTNADLHSIALSIFEWCVGQQISIFMQWIPTCSNLHADYPSKLGCVTCIFLVNWFHVQTSSTHSWQTCQPLQLCMKTVWFCHMGSGHWSDRCIFFKLVRRKYISLCPQSFWSHRQ